MNAAHPRPFGALLKGYREAAGLTQEELADRAALSPRGLIYLERGARQPYPDTVRRLADALALGPQERATLQAAARAGRASPPSLICRGHPVPALPLPPTPLIGREQEVAAATALLEREE